MSYVVALDIGGTGLRIGVRNHLDGTEFRERVSSYSVGEHGWERALAQTSIEVNRSLDSYGIPVAQVRGLLAYIAGAGGSENQQRWQDHFIKDLGVTSIVRPDNQLPLSVCLPDLPAVGLTVGTGSSVVARPSGSGFSASVDGWGPVVGDKGGGYWIGREALSAVLEAYDGRSSLTNLTAPLLARLDVATERKIPSLFIGGTLRTSTVASLAPTVISVAEDGDQVAVSIVDSALREVARSIVAALRQLENPESISLGAVGGLVTGSTLYRSRLMRHIDRLGVEVRRITFIDDTVSTILDSAAEIYPACHT